MCCVVVIRSTTQHKTQRAVYFCLGVDVLLCSGAHDTTTHNSGFLAFVLCIWSVCVVALVRHRRFKMYAPNLAMGHRYFWRAIYLSITFKWRPGLHFLSAV